MDDKKSCWYPKNICADKFGGFYNQISLNFLYSKNNVMNHKKKSELGIAEIGIWKGATSYQFAKYLNGEGILHIFDYQDKVDNVEAKLNIIGFSNVEKYGSTYKYLDSYNWQLMKILKSSDKPIFDYVYIDGAHTWAIDALTFFLCDLLLKPGGYIDFDDYPWKLRGSTVDPTKIPEISELYTDEQIDSQQVKLIVDILVKRNSFYKEVIRNKIFQKVCS